MNRELREVDEGLTITELIGLAGIPSWAVAQVYINEHLVLPRCYAITRPKRGTRVTIRAVPRGGGGGGRKLIIGIVLIIIGIILAFTPLSVLAPYVISLGVSLTLSGIINILLPPPTPPRLRPLSGLGAQESESPTLSISGSRNDSRPYAVVPRVVGRHRIFPPDLSPDRSAP